jgi:hypothetical protein
MMNNATGQSKILWAIVVVMVTLSLWLLLAWRTDSEAQSAGKGQYEYGELSAIQSITIFPNSNQTSFFEVAWETRNSRITAKSYKEMCEKLGGRAAYDSSTPVLNLLADKGWELVTQTHSHAATPSTDTTRAYMHFVKHVWTFRRRR